MQRLGCEKSSSQKRVIMGFGHRVYRSGDSRVPTMRHYLFKVAKLLKENTQKFMKS